MLKIITISRTELTELNYDKPKVTYDGQPPDTRNQEPLITALKALAE